MPTQKKIDTVEKLTEKIAKAKTVVFADYRGLKHKQLEDLRKALKKVQGEFVVTKNRLLARALASRAKDVKDELRQSTATLFSYADEIAPLKELLKYFKTAGMGKTRGGFMGETVLSDGDVTRLAQLPTHKVLLAQLVRQLNAPIQGLHYALSWNLKKFVYALREIQSSKTK